MEIFTSKAMQKAVIICDAEEFEKLTSSLFYTAVKWLKMAEKNEDGMRDTDLRLAEQYRNLHAIFANAKKELHTNKAKED